MGLFLSILGKSSLKLIIIYSTYRVPWHVSISELNESEVEIRPEIFWAYIRIDKIMSESNVCLLKPKILCLLVLIQFNLLSNTAYPARDQGNKPGLSSLYACPQKN